jgi:hypothetical protein
MCRPYSGLPVFLFISYEPKFDNSSCHLRRELMLLYVSRLTPIVIKKKPVTETKTISEQVTSEKVTVKNPEGEEVREEKEEQEGEV